MGFVTNPQINEASGLVASQTHSDLFWTLNDSDGPNCIYALAKNGTLGSVDLLSHFTKVKCDSWT